MHEVLRIGFDCNNEIYYAAPRPGITGDNALPDSFSLCAVLIPMTKLPEESPP